MPPVNTSPPASWKQWFQNHGSRLLLFARQQTRTPEDAEDVLQEAMLRLWKSGMIDIAEDGTDLRRVELLDSKRTGNWNWGGKRHRIGC